MLPSSPTDDAAALQQDLAACMRLAGGEAPDAGSSAANAGFDALVADFVERAARLRRSFVRARLWQDEQQAERDEHSASAIRGEIDALKAELRDKEVLLAKHRLRVERWDSECRAVQQSCEAEVLSAGERASDPGE